MMRRHFGGWGGALISRNNFAPAEERHNFESKNSLSQEFVSGPFPSVIGKRSASDLRGHPVSVMGKVEAVVRPTGRDTEHVWGP